MTTAVSVRVRLRTLLTTSAVAMAATVVIASAVIRHAQAGFGCAPWPACYGNASVTATAAQSPPVQLARTAHRLAATAVTVLIVTLIVLAWGDRAQLQLHLRSLLWALAIAVALAILGASMPGSRLPVVTMANFLGGFGVLASLAAARVTIDPRSAPDPLLGRAAVITLASLFLQAAVGALIGGQFAAAVCAGPSACEPWTWSEALTGGAWNPLRSPVLANGQIVAPAGASMLHLVHRALGALVVVGLIAVGALARERGRLTSWVLVALALAEPGIGFWLAGPSAGLAAVLAHHIVAAVLVTILAGVAVSARSGLNAGVRHSRAALGLRSA